MFKVLAGMAAPALVLAGIPVPSTPLVTESDAKALAERTMAKFVSEDYKGGFDLLAPYWNAPRAELDTLVMQTLQQRSTIKPRYGESLGYELISTKRAGTSILRLTYIEKLQNTALRYTFMFYRVHNAWVFQGMFWDDKLNLLFNE